MQNADKKKVCCFYLSCKNLLQMIYFCNKTALSPTASKIGRDFFSCIQSLYFFIFQTRMVTTFFILFMQATENMKKSTIYFLLLKQKATVAFSGVMNYKRGSLKTSQFPCLRLLFLVLVCILVDLGPKTLSSLFLLGSLTSKGIFKIIGKLQNIFW